MERIDVLQQKYFEEIKQTDEACFYLPEHVPGQIVTFIGQCDENISVVQNFNVNRVSYKIDDISVSTLLCPRTGHSFSFLMRRVGHRSENEFYIVGLAINHQGGQVRVGGLCKTLRTI